MQIQRKCIEPGSPLVVDPDPSRAEFFQKHAERAWLIAAGACDASWRVPVVVPLVVPVGNCLLERASCGVSCNASPNVPVVVLDAVEAMAPVVVPVVASVVLPVGRCQFERASCVLPTRWQ